MRFCKSVILVGESVTCISLSKIKGQTFALYKIKNGKIANNGVEMPVLGFGVFQVTDLAECEEV
jgi:hypothetical protein